MSVLTERIPTLPSLLLRSERKIKRWHLWLIRVIFLSFILGELYLGNYIQDEGLFSSTVIGGAIALSLIYLLVVWVASVNTIETTANSNEEPNRISGESLWILNEEREITRPRLWLARAGTLIVAIIAVGYQAYISPTQFLNVEETPYVSIALLIIVIGTYWATLQYLSHYKDDSDNSKK